MHQNWEITDGIRSHRNFSVHLELLSTRSGVSDLHDVKTVDTLVSLFLTECKKAVLVGGVAFREWQFHEAASVALKDLSLFALDVVKLHK